MADDIYVVATLFVCATGPLQLIGMER